MLWVFLFNKLPNVLECIICTSTILAKLCAYVVMFVAQDIKVWLSSDRRGILFSIIIVFLVHMLISIRLMSPKIAGKAFVSKKSGWYLVVRVNCWDGVCASASLVLAIHVNANTSCFWLVADHWMWNCVPREQVCVSYNYSTNALTAISILVVWLVSCMPGFICFVWTLSGHTPGLIT